MPSNPFFPSTLIISTSGFVSDLFEIRPNFRKYFLRSEDWRLKGISAICKTNGNGKTTGGGIFRSQWNGFCISPLCLTILKGKWALHSLITCTLSWIPITRIREELGKCAFERLWTKKVWEDLNILNIDFPEAATCRTASASLLVLSPQNGGI